MAYRSPVSLGEIRELCDKLFARDGFVKWSDVGEALGLSRQAIQARLKAAVAKGDLSPEVVERWQSLGSRRAAARENRKASNERYEEKRRLRLELELTEGNYVWLRSESVLRKTTMPELINGIIAKSREAKEV